MAKSFDKLANRTMTKSSRRRARERSADMMAELFLREIRQIAGLSQTELAGRLGIKQPTLSRIESHEQDMQIETLRRIVQALGGELDVVARFPKTTIRIAEFSDKSNRRDDSRPTRVVEQLQLV